ncbi:NmrA family NAD(P)-binding protein [Chryseobacterium formosus]|uniref:NmrA family NAD(P)-binding protein n=1 Tax=Chryseobacterium formosus TaxID=1537363 RepID=A0ABT3XV62_9FLAO|nr:NmrA family NAD(P)-binding protein [Chryseobacterium formosus]MCX8525560.1 NmrA family NAD(P)-binding protein [Chryseobacterium formosus]
MVNLQNNLNDMSNNKLIVVAGAAGTQGGAVVDALLAKGIAVRAIVRNKNTDAAKALAARNVDVVEASFDDVESLTEAVRGGTGIFSMQMGSHPGNKGEESQHAKNLVTAAKSAGVEQIVHTSVARAGDHKNFVGWNEGKWEPTYWEEKVAAIDIVKEAGFSYWTIIKPPLIMENLLPSKSATLFPTIAQGKLFSALQPETILDWISPQNIGQFAAEAFVQPEKFNKKEFAIVGDKLTLPEIAETLSSVIGRKFEVKTITQEEATELGFHELSHQSFSWMNAEGYKVDQQEAAEFGIETESLKTYLERNKSILLAEYSE